MPQRIIRIVAFAVLGSVLAGLCLFGLAFALVTCYDYPFARRDHPPPVPALPRQAGIPSEPITFPLPISDEPEVQTDQRTFDTDGSVEQVLAFYQQELVAAGWEADYNVNPRTNQMYILNKQAGSCPVSVRWLLRWPAHSADQGW